jgi:hypothetical protein
MRLLEKYPYRARQLKLGCPKSGKNTNWLAYYRTLRIKYVES